MSNRSLAMSPALPPANAAALQPLVRSRLAPIVRRQPDQSRRRKHQDGVTALLPEPREIGQPAQTSAPAENAKPSKRNAQLLRQRMAPSVMNARISIATPANYFPNRLQQNP